MGCSVKGNRCVDSTFAIGGLDRQNDHLQSVLIGLHQHGPLMVGVEVDLTAHPAVCFFPFAIIDDFKVHLVPATFAVGSTVSEVGSGNFIIAAHALDDVDIFNHRFVGTIFAVCPSIVDVGKRQGVATVFAYEVILLIRAVAAVINTIVELTDGDF